MDKQLVLSVAGSGKTTMIVNSLSLEKNAIVITYTDNNYSNLRSKVIQKFGYLPDNITIISYFNFLYSFCYKPFLDNYIQARGYNFDIPPQFTLHLKRTNPKYYLDSYRRLYHNRLAKMLEVYKVDSMISDRLKKYFDEMYVDEVQDFAGHDFNLLLAISDIDIKVLFVGDFFQHTFDTSRDGSVNKSLHDSYDSYIERFHKAGFNINLDLLSKSHRCSKSICEFVTNNLNINILSHNDIATDILLLENEDEISGIIEDDSIIKLFYQNSKKFNCYSMNWGDTKGQDDYVDVCVILNNKTYNQYKNDKLNEVNVRTRNKFYVACTRARKTLYLVPENLVASYKY